MMGVPFRQDWALQSSFGIDEENESLICFVVKLVIHLYDIIYH